MNSASLQRAPLSAARVDPPFVYVLLLNWNGWSHTIECLESVLRLRYPAFRVIVCDNGSTDGSVQQIRRWAESSLAAPAPPDRGARERMPVPKPVACVEQDRALAEAGGGSADGDAQLVIIRNGANLGFSAGNNVGIRYALRRGDAAYVWLLNNDTTVDPDALSELVQVAERSASIGMVGGKLLRYDRPETIQAAAGGRLVRWNGSTRLYGAAEVDRGQWDRPFDPGYIHGACLLVRTELIQTLGMLDEAYFAYSEEVDWCLRAQSAGWRLGYAPGCRVWHKEGRAFGQKSPLQDYHSIRSRLILTRKFYPHLLPLAALHVLYQAVLPKLVRRQPDRLRAVMRAYREVLAGATSSTTR